MRLGGAILQGMPAAVSRHRAFLLAISAAIYPAYAQKLIRSRLSEGQVVGLPSQAERLLLQAGRGA
jgi:hypothetical protein